MGALPVPVEWLELLPMVCVWKSGNSPSLALSLQQTTTGRKTNGSNDVLQGVASVRDSFDSFRDQFNVWLLSAIRDRFLSLPDIDSFVVNCIDLKSSGCGDVCRWSSSYC